jgi:hypothetical protein
MTTNELIAEANKADKDFFDEAFKGHFVPYDIKRLSIRLCRSYGIKGICDPMYIANIIALELGIGDGQGNFNPSL